MSENEVSSLEVLKFDVEDMSLRPGSRGRAVVDEVAERGEGIAVYVEGDGVSYDSPPRRLNKKMLEHGYSYVDWVMNGKPKDKRAIFEYVKSQ